MKTKLVGLIAIAIIAIIALPLAGCKSDEPITTEQPKDQTTTITGLFDNNASATVKGNFTDTEWNGIPDIIKTALNTVFTPRSDAVKNIWRTVYSRGVTFIVEKSPYYYWKTIGDGKTVYLSLDATNTEILDGYMLSAILGSLNGNFSEVVLPPTVHQKQPDTLRTLSFGTEENPCTVTITSDDQFTATEWKTLCDKVVATIERGYDAANAFAKTGIANHFTNNTVSAVLLKSATYDVEVKNTVPNTMYFKANGSAIDGISGADFLGIINSIVTNSSYHLP
jgi:hypothetical protein